MGATDMSEIAYEILAYLAKNPHAGDTSVGISGWWLLTQHIEREIERQRPKVEKALAELVSKGLIIAEPLNPGSLDKVTRLKESTSKSSQTYYRLNQRKRKEISKLLSRGSITLESSDK